MYYNNVVSLLLSTLIGFKMLWKTSVKNSFHLTPSSIKELHKPNSILSKNVDT